MKTINEAMKNLKESKRISLKEANETATFELDWANEDIANMENDQEKELTLIKNVENTLKTNKIGAKVEVISLDGNGFGGWPIVKVTGPKEDLAKNIGLYYLDNNEDEIDYNDIYDTYLENKELKEAEPTKLDNIVKVDPNKKEITYPEQDKNDPRKPSDITKDELLNSDKNEKELPSTENGTAKKEIQDMLDRSWNRKYNIGIENEDKEIKTEYAKNTKYYRIQNGKETEVNQSMLIGKLQALKTDIKLGVTLRNDYTIDDIDDMLEKVNQGESIKLFDAWYLNEEDYNGNKSESTEDNTAKKESKVVKEAEENSEEVKEYHKLSRDHIEELIKTGKLDDYFDTLQRDEIRIGLEKGIDISKYADPKYDAFQMRQIRFGLQDNLDISKYADPKYEWEQMRYLRMVLKRGIDTSQFDFKQIEQIALGIINNLDISKYADPKYDVVEMEWIRFGLENGVDISKYANSRQFDFKQIEQIIQGLKDNLDISKYADPKYDWLQMEQIRFGLEDNLDISKYADPKYNWVEMGRIRHKLKSNNQGDTTKNIENSKTIKESTEFYTDEALKVLDYIQNEMTNEQRKKLFIDECGDFEFDNEVDQLKEFWDWIELLDSDDIEELGNKLNIIEEPEYQSDKELEMRKINESNNEITLDDIADKASELGYEILGDERDDEGLTILVYKPESAETDNFDDFDNEELYSYLSTVPNVRYQIDNDDQSCLAIWLKESKVVKESNDLEEKDATDMLIEIEEWYKNYSSSNAFYEDLSNIIDYNKLINWYKSL